MKDKFFRISKQYSTSSEAYSRYNKRIQVDVHGAAAGKWGEIDAAVGREICDDWIMPESSQYETVRKILEEDYLRVFNPVFATLRQFDCQQKECYIVRHSPDFIVLYAYTPDNVKPKACCVIDVRDFNTEVLCSVTLNSRFGHRPTVRKSGERISCDMFSKIHALVLEYLYDSASLTVLLDKFMTEFRRLTADESAPLKPLRPVADFSAAAEQIKMRKDALCRQLMELDESKEKRMMLRAEIAGLDYALRVIDTNGQVAP